MLRVTPAAGAAIESLTDAEGVAEGGGLRIQPLSEDRAVGDQDFDISVAALARDGDQTVVEDGTGTRVFLDPVAVEQLDGKILDADRTVEGNYTFTVREVSQ